jgi:hypothetical protein
VRRAFAPFALAARDDGVRQGFEYGRVGAHLRPVLAGCFLQFRERQAVQVRGMSDRGRRDLFAALLDTKQSQDPRLIAPKRIKQVRRRGEIRLDQQSLLVDTQPHAGDLRCHECLGGTNERDLQAPFLV